MTRLFKFTNHKKETLRGLWDLASVDKDLIFVHGFERTTVESKFKNIVDRLGFKFNMLRFDFSGCGLSDGKFKDLTVEKQTKELDKAVREIRGITSAKTISFVAHSFGCAVVMNYLSSGVAEPERIKSINVGKVVFLSPALNQKELHRFWFTKNNAETEITWANYKKYFSGLKNLFEKEMKRSPKMTKEHLISNAYFLENKDIDYQDLFELLPFDLSKILIIHGDADDKVPMESNDKLPAKVKKIIVSGGDHDLQRPDMVKQYLNKVIQFLLKD
ncbi:MAG: alpha/beta fold hydrolase [Patescibacteria group bacterium]